MARKGLADFPIGCTVRVVHVPWRYARDKGAYLFAIGTVTEHYDEGRGDVWVDVAFDPRAARLGQGRIFRPWWLERGRVDWVPDDPRQPAPSAPC